MQCLRCSNEALVGKALCAQCLSRYQSQREVEQSEEWVQEQLQNTRRNIRKIGGNQKSLAEEFQAAMTKLAPLIVVVFVLVAAGPYLFRSKVRPIPIKTPKSSASGVAVKGDTAGQGSSASETPNDSETPTDDEQGDSEPGESDTPTPEADVQPTSVVEEAVVTTPVLVESPTSTPTETPTATPTETPTATPTIKQGD